jgi:hypothetical protein
MGDLEAHDVRPVPDDLPDMFPATEPRGTTEVQEHGEYGPVLVDGTQNFTTKRDVERRR